VATIQTPGRTILGGQIEDTWLNSTSTQTSTTVDAKTLESNTSMGPPYTQNNNFLMARSETRMGFLNGSSKPGASTPPRYYYRNCYVHGGPQRAGAYNHPMFNPSWQTAALAAINPVQPVVSLPNLLFELREFPKMLHDLGRVLLAKEPRYADLPGAHLAWQFGWAPLISDLTKLCNLAGEIETLSRKFAQIGKTKKAEGSVGVLPGTRTERYFVRNTPFEVVTRYQYSTRVWYSAHWGLQTIPPNFYGGNRLQSLMAAMGFHSAPSVIWEAIPWSFLVDYFVNVGTFIEATGGIMKYRPAELCIMWQTDERAISTDFYASDPGPVYLTDFHRKAVTKQRRVVSDPFARPGFAIHPIADKLATLSSLATAKALGGISAFPR
jgi:hypothetical protein